MKMFGKLQHQFVTFHDVVGGGMEPEIILIDFQVHKHFDDLDF